MASNFFILLTLLTFSLSFYGTYAVNYTVTNVVPDTPGGQRFEKDIGVPYTKQIMEESVNFIWSKVFQTNDPAERKPIESVNVFIDDLKDGDKGVALMWGGNNINFSNTKIETYKGEGAWDVKKEFTAVMYHEMTHVLQWGGDGKANPGLQEGSADYTKIKADLMQPGFAKPGTGDKWDHGYGETARFLEYCDSVTPDFVAKLYKKMKTSYDDSYFQELTGKPVDELWKDYKAKYAGGNKPGPARRLSTISDYSN